MAGILDIINTGAHIAIALAVAGPFVVHGYRCWHVCRCLRRLGARAIIGVDLYE